jgi:type III restriction enzyme
MSNRISFQFDDELVYQKEAIKSVVDLFKGVSRKNESTIYENINRVRKFDEGDPVRNPQIIKGTKLLNNLRDVQIKNMLFVDNQLLNNNYTIEMETGTGKTYVYLRTILELYKTYGFSKFMIIVPSIAIRKGVEKSIDMLRNHFKALYDGLDLVNHSFVYDSGNPKQINSSFVEPMI